VIAGISNRAKLTFDNIVISAQENRLCVAACTERRTGRKVYVVCESYVEDGATQFVPLARLFSGNPHNEITPPGLSAHKLI